MIRLTLSINYVFLLCKLRLSTFLLLTANLLQIFIKNKLSSIGCSNSFGTGLALSGASVAGQRSNCTFYFVGYQFYLHRVLSICSLILTMNSSHWPMIPGFRTERQSSDRKRFVLSKLATVGIFWNSILT